jgi:hypothetical protein
MEKLFYQTRSNYNPPPSVRYEAVDLDMPSMTKQDDSYTIVQLLQRMKAGLPLTQTEPVYLDVEDVEHINEYFNPGQLDLTDLDQLKENIAFMQSAVKKAEANKKAAEKEEQKDKDRHEAEQEILKQKRANPGEIQDVEPVEEE